MGAFIKRVAILAAFFGMSSVAQASLIINGSFEQVIFEDGSLSHGQVKNTNLADFQQKNRGWDIFEVIPGWFTSVGNGIEIHKNIVTSSQDGNQHVELDSHRRSGSNSMMTQTLTSLIIGNEYQLEYYYKPRTNNQNDNGINVYWFETGTVFDNSISAMHTSDGTRRQQPNWQLQTMSFTAQATSMDLSFAATGTQNTLGGLIDNVSLVNVTQVPEPSTLIMFLLPIGLMIARSKRQAK